MGVSFLMDKQDKVISSLKFLNYIVNKVEFETNSEFRNGNNINIDFNIDHSVKFNDKKMDIVLKLVVFDKMKENNYPFKLYVEISGFFETEGNDIETFKSNGLAILYPYLRSTVSVYTSNSNMATLILPPINIVNYLKNKEKINKRFYLSSAFSMSTL